MAQLHSRQRILYEPGYRLLVPTPEVLEDRVRLYYGKAREDFVSRIYCVELDIDDLTKVIYSHPDPVLDIGEDGMFDDNGVIPSQVIHNVLIYSGFQLGVKHRYTIFTGLSLLKTSYKAIRSQKTPLLGRTEDSMFIHSSAFYYGVFAFYVSGSHWFDGPEKKIPIYWIKGGARDEDILPPLMDEYGTGRPSLIHHNGLNWMTFVIRPKNGQYKIGLAKSFILSDWKRVPVETEDRQPWESGGQCYPYIVRVKDKIVVFYSGNNFGMDGIGYGLLDLD